MPLERFPGVLGEIAEAAGEEAALKLGAAYGGTRVFFPAELSANTQWLVNCVGQDAAETICDYFRIITASDQFAGAYLELPRGGITKIEFREKIIDLSYDGYSAAEIARILGTTERTVYRVRAKHRGGSPQPKTRRLWLPPREQR